MYCLLSSPSFNEHSTTGFPTVATHLVVVVIFAVCMRWDWWAISWLPIGKQSVQQWRVIQLRLIEKCITSGASAHSRLSCQLTRLGIAWHSKASFSSTAHFFLLFFCVIRILAQQLWQPPGSFIFELMRQRCTF